MRRDKLEKHEDKVDSQWERAIDWVENEIDSLWVNKQCMLAVMTLIAAAEYRVSVVKYRVDLLEEAVGQVFLELDELKGEEDAKGKNIETSLQDV